MTVYLDLVFFLNFAVDLLLLRATDRLSGRPTNWHRAVPAAALGGVYGAVCLLPGFHFLGNWFWRLTVLILMAVLSCGISRQTVRQVLLYILLSMALGGIAASMTAGGVASVLIAGLALIILVRFCGRPGERRFVRVRLVDGERQWSFLALCDTGNSLKDPITGRSVLILGADAGCEVLGLTQNDLRDPAGTAQKIGSSRFRLIPYRAVGRSGLLLAARFDEVYIDGGRVEVLVAFAPECIGRGEGYQALTGGLI